MDAGMIGKLGKPSHWLTLFCLATLLAQTGCTRRFFRQCADREVAEVLRQKDQFPAWAIENFHVYPDSRARFADPTNPDRPPMPPDDPAAQWLGPNPQRPCKAGVARIEGDVYLSLLATWDAENRALRKSDPEKYYKDEKTGDIRLVVFQGKEGNQNEPGPDPRALPSGEPKPYLLRIDQAMELGLINSREYQTRREGLYLTALPVTQERFAFAPQFFAIEESIRERTGSEAFEGAGDRWRLNSSTGVTKLFSTGALLLLAYANRTVIDLGNHQGQHTTSVSTLNLDIIQPLLRGGGKAVTLEPLTQSERNLLYEIRDYARFRKEFFQYITGGGEIVVPSSGIGGRGLSPGAIALATGNPARPQILAGSAGRLALGTGAVAPSTGFMPTLLLRAQLQNETKNAATLEKYLKLFKAFAEGGDVAALQVGQVELNLLRSRSTILQRDKDLREGLDQFKLQLGLPTSLPLELDQEITRPIQRQLDQFETVLQQYEAIVKSVDDAFNPAEANKRREALRQSIQKEELVRKTKNFKTAFPEVWSSFEKLTAKELDQRLLRERSDRRVLLEEKAKLEAKQAKGEENKQSLNPEELARLGKLEEKLRGLEFTLAVGDFEFYLRKYEEKPWEKEKGDKAQKREHENRFRDYRNALVLVLGKASSERLEMLETIWPNLPVVMVEGLDLLTAPLEVGYEITQQTALTNRLDLMNERARVQDAWRQIAVFANSLLGVFNVGYHMDSNTPPGAAQPLAFSSSRTRHQLFLNAELPLVRLAERNSYRASQIALQRARRNLMEAEDQISLQVRSDLRQLRVLAENYKIQQRSVVLAYQQVESALETFQAPPDPADKGRSSAANAAALTQQLLNAQSGLVGAQNELYRLYINYLIARQQLFVDLELMPLDPRGVWIDEFIARQPNPQPGEPDESNGPVNFPRGGQPQAGIAPAASPALVP